MTFPAALFRDAAIAGLFSDAAFRRSFRLFEIALTRAMAAQGLADPAAAARAIAVMERFTPDIAAIDAATERDGLPVPEFVRQLKRAAGADTGAVHPGTTSQDLIDTAMALAIRAANEVYRGRLTAVLADLHRLESAFGNNPAMGRTRMQAALPIGVADRIAAWRGPLGECLDGLDAIAERAEAVQLGGPVGRWDAEMGAPGQAVRRAVAEELGLQDPGRCWHTARGPLVDYGNWLSQVTGALGKLGLDLSLMALQGIGEARIAGGGGSSAMPHKQNPILAEKLVTLARFNAVQIAGLHQTLLHEQERSGAAWALEWMILPAMAEATGRALSDALALLGAVERLGKAADTSLPIPPPQGRREAPRD